MKKVITRRDFMKKSAYAILGTAVGFSPLGSQSSGQKSRVVLIRHKDALDENLKFNQTIIQQMLDEAVTALFGLDDAVKVFKQLVKPGDIVGIKSNEWNYIPTPPELENAIKQRVLDAGVEEANIGIDDRAVRKNPIFQKATALINVRPLRTHYLAGMSGCIKNYITFSENWSANHPNNCEDLARCFFLPMVKGKTRLNILSALTPQFHGRGPHGFDRRYVWEYKGLIVGTDPVAVDSVALRIIMAKRTEHFGSDNRLPALPRHIRAADVKHGLGNSDPGKIELIKLGWKEGSLI
jgi:uncharacterized protein (DUF362 family)